MRCAVDAIRASDRIRPARDAPQLSLSGSERRSQGVALGHERPIPRSHRGLPQRPTGASKVTEAALRLYGLFCGVGGPWHRQATAVRVVRHASSAAW